MIPPPDYQPKAGLKEVNDLPYGSGGGHYLNKGRFVFNKPNQVVG